VDRSGHSVKIDSFRKAWYDGCVKAGLGNMVPVMDTVTGEPVYERPRGPRSKPKAKMTYEGMIFHNLRRTGTRNLVHASVPKKVAMAIGGWKTRSIFGRCNIVARKDVTEAGRKLEIFHNQAAAKVGDISGTVCTTMQ
jgi:hypothetical protein